MITNINMTHNKDPTEMTKIVSDIFIFPGVWFEQFGLYSSLYSYIVVSKRNKK